MFFLLVFEDIKQFSKTVNKQTLITSFLLFKKKKSRKQEQFYKNTKIVFSVFLKIVFKNNFQKQESNKPLGFFRNPENTKENKIQKNDFLKFGFTVKNKNKI